MKRDQSKPNPVLVAILAIAAFCSIGFVALFDLTSYGPTGSGGIIQWGLWATPRLPIGVEHLAIWSDRHNGLVFALRPKCYEIPFAVGIRTDGVKLQRGRILADDGR